VWDSLLQCRGGSEMVDGMWCDAVQCSAVQCDRMAVYCNAVYRVCYGIN
jgi:hypothetical protein